MKNNMKKIISLTLCIIMMLALSVPAFATSPTPEWFENAKKHIYRIGDLNGDGQVTSADARICLQAAAGLTELTGIQSAAANYKGESGFKPISAAARKILRVAAKLDSFDDTTVHIFMYEGESYFVGSFENVEPEKCMWSCEVDTENGLEVSQTVVAPQALGYPVCQQFTLIAKRAGTYNVIFKLNSSVQTEPIEQIEYTVVVEKLHYAGGLIWDDMDVILDNLDTTPRIFEDEDGYITVGDSWLTFDNKTGDGDAEVTIGGDELTKYFSDKTYPFDFERLVTGDSEVDASDYTVTIREESIIITLKEEYVRTLEEGIYLFEAQYKKAAVPVILYVAREKFELKDAVFTCINGQQSKAAWAYLDSDTYNFDFYNELFVRLTYKGEEIDSANYIVHGFEGTGYAETVILLKDEYVKTLAPGEYYFEAEFVNVTVMLKLTVS